MLIRGRWQDELYKLDESSVDLIIIDPPYMTTKEAWDNEEQVNPELSRQLFRIAKESCSLYVWCGIGEKSQSLIRWFPIFDKDWYFKDLITWKKQRGIGMRKGWLYTREELMWFVKDNKKFVWNKKFQYGDEKRTVTMTFSDKEREKKYLKSLGSSFKRLTNVWTDIRETNISWNKKERTTEHFTPKPRKAIERIIQTHTIEGDLVLDCFLGSGTTMMVSNEMNRRCIGIESEPDFVDAIKSSDWYRE